jgi:F5/8 type C domain
MRSRAAAFLGAATVLVCAAPARAKLLDDFEDVSRWTPAPAQGVSLTIGTDAGARGRSMRLDFDFHGHGGYAIVRRAIDLELPDNYAFSFRVRGEAPPNDLEFKLVDLSGDDVWWAVQKGFAFPETWRRIVLKKRKIAFAWGPRGGGTLARVGAIELAITAGSGGKGTVWIDDLELTPLPPEHPYGGVPTATASAVAPSGGPAAAIDGDPATAWSSGPLGSAPVDLAVDFGEPREFGGLVVSWGDDRATDYDVDVSDDGASWTTIRTVRGGDGPRDWLELPDQEARYLRIRLRRGPRNGYTIREIDVRPLAFGDSPNSFFAAVAEGSPRGAYPRYWLGQQVYWTIVGVSGGDEDVLLNEDGTIETGKGGPSLEPFVSWSGGPSAGWSGVARSVELQDGDLPIPTVTWSGPGFELVITAFSDGPPEAPTVWVRYRLTNRGGKTRPGILLLALRPFQVNPPWQFLGTPGGAAPVTSLSWNGTALIAGGCRAVVPLTRPETIAMLPFDAGDVAVRWLAGRAPQPAAALDDPVGRASAGLFFDVPALAPGASWETAVAIPLGSHDGGGPHPVDETAGLPGLARRLASARAAWRDRLDRVRFDVPPEADVLVRTMRSNLAFTLINRHGPAIQPGSRSYARAWIRDGTLASTALLRLGHPDEARAFASWFATYQYPDGRVPCCVDARGADPVPENDSHGELIHLIAEVGRFTRDDTFLASMWPHVVKAVGAIDDLRHQRLTEEYREPGRRAYYGLLPESISHEGYSDKPRHSYWDDFFAMTGLDDAVAIAGTLGKSPERERFAAIRDAFREDLLASIEATMAMHGIATLPGCVELGDFDPTSTTVALDPAGLLPLLPRAAVDATFERYYESFVKRRDGAAPWTNYTPYELRIVGSFVRLGWTARAHEALAFFLRDRRPAPWNAWAEVVWRDAEVPKFVGDIPHTWVGTDFIRSFLDLFAYERPHDGSLVIAGGIPMAWARAARGVGVRGLRTPWGPLSWSMHASGGTVRVHVDEGIAMPPGGIVVAPPEGLRPREAFIDGKPVAVSTAGEVAIRSVPADVRVVY